MRQKREIEQGTVLEDWAAKLKTDSRKKEEIWPVLTISVAT